VLSPTPRPKKLIGSGRFPQVALVGTGGSGPLDHPPSAAPGWERLPNEVRRAEIKAEGQEHVGILEEGPQAPPAIGSLGIERCTTQYLRELQQNLLVLVKAKQHIIRSFQY